MQNHLKIKQLQITESVKTPSFGYYYIGSVKKKDNTFNFFKFLKNYNSY